MSLLKTSCWEPRERKVFSCLACGFPIHFWMATWFWTRWATGPSMFFNNKSLYIAIFVLVGCVQLSLLRLIQGPHHSGDWSASEEGCGHSCTCMYTHKSTYNLPPPQWKFSLWRWVGWGKLCCVGMSTSLLFRLSVSKWNSHCKNLAP